MVITHLDQAKWHCSGRIDIGEEGDIIPRSKTTQIIQGGVAVGLQEQGPLGVAVDLVTAIIGLPQPPGVGVEGNQGLAKRRLDHRRVEKVGGAVEAVEEDEAGIVGDWKYCVQVRQPQTSTRRFFHWLHQRCLLHFHLHIVHSQKERESELERDWFSDTAYM